MKKKKSIPFPLKETGLSFIVKYMNQKAVDYSQSLKVIDYIAKFLSALLQAPINE